MGGYYLKLTVNEVALILGLPNRGELFEFKRVPYSDAKHNHLLNDLDRLVGEDLSPALEVERVDALVKYVLCKFFFPLKSLRIPLCLRNFGGLHEFRRFNWPQAVHAFLHSQIEALNALGSKMEDPASLGYLEGCSIVLVVWFFEHTNMQVPFNDLGSPRLCRLFAKGGFSFKFCSDLTAKLSKTGQVRTKFTEYSQEEQDLSGDEEEESSFEELRRLRPGKKDKVKEEKIRKVMEERKKEKEKEIWYFFDSLPNPTHHEKLRSLIADLYGDVCDAWPGSLPGWDMSYVLSAPTQGNSHDCGMFVLKYMETVTSKRKIAWTKCRDWQKNMPRFRAEIAYDILKCLMP